ncbi:MAG: PAS domain-containing protein, partial [Gammaproteobacteria bacterium]|nr:PAS domain-containing protein [Gammaproteobacteria bacterium]
WRRPGFQAQVVTQVIFDIVAITLIMHASGGVRSGFGMLLVVSIAGGSMLTGGRTAILFAAIASLAVLIQEMFSWFHQMYPDTAYTQSGMLGATFFAAASLAFVLARRVRASEALARQRATDLASLSQLNELIIQRMQSGILAVDSRDNVRLINESAQRLLGVSREEEGISLELISSELAERVKEWRKGMATISGVVWPESSDAAIIASFAKLEQPTSSGLLIFLEDSTVVTQRAQQLKLAALGRLTASIAHEVRNPLGAISHAGQLLAESPDLSSGDQRLTEMIRKQSLRVNAIIENVLQLSRRRPPAAENFNLNRWLREFVADYTVEKGLAEGDIQLDIGDDDLEIYMDAGQLRQVIENLCDNGLRYSRGIPRLILDARLHPDAERVYLDVLDSGEGVAEDMVEHLFEPFFTGESNGTGLGLYIARELCEVNQASLAYPGLIGKGNCFRIIFVHPHRQKNPVL